jgi:hypothetical protein
MAGGRADDHENLARGDAVLLRTARCALMTMLFLLPAAAASAATIRYVSPSGSDGGSCSQLAPCRSLDAAYQVSAPGDVVEVRGGSYPSQNIRASSKGAPRVTIRAAAGARPVLGGLDVHASHLQVVGPFLSRSLTTANISGPKVTDTLVQDIEVDAQGTDETPGWIAAVDGVTWRRINIHNARDANALLYIDGSYPNNGSVKRLVIEDSAFHDVTVPAGSSTHSQCIYLLGTQSSVIRRNSFWNCAIFDIFQSGDIDNTTDLLVENNTMEAPRLQGGACCAYFTLRFAWGVPQRVTLRNNSSAHQMDFRLGAVNSKVVGNAIQRGMSCADGVTFSHNVVTGTRGCSPTDKRVSDLGFRNTDAHDFRLEPGSAAIDAGDPADAPATDKLGFGRRGRPDAGALEFGGIPPSTGPVPSGPATGLVGAWGFNEGRGRTANDGSGSGHAGRIKGALRVKGRFGRALRFDGAGDRVRIPDTSTLDLSRGMTLEAWVKPNGRRLSGRPVIVKKRSKGLSYGLYAGGAIGRPAAVVKTARQRRLGTRSQLRRGRWSHLAVTWNGRLMRIYVNGKQRGKTRVTRPLSRSAGPLLIGAAGGRRSFRGVIDEVRIYNRALSRAQVRADRKAAVG